MSGAVTTVAETSTALAAAFARALEARKIDISEAPKLSVPEANEIFREVRWAESDGRPLCPLCSSERPYVLRNGQYKCRNKSCYRRFSSTSLTKFASHKLPMPLIVLASGAITHRDMTATRLCDIMGTTYKTAIDFAHRFGLAGGRRSNVADKQALFYPYKRAHSREEGYDLIYEISQALPVGLPHDMRADVAQEMALAVLCGDIQREQIKAMVQKYMRGWNAQLGNKWRDVSIDAPLNADGFTLNDVLTGDRSFEYWEHQ